jgi:hypothetical protein
MSGVTQPAAGDPSAGLATMKGATQTLGQLVVAAQRQCFTVGTVIGGIVVGTSLISVLATPTPAIVWIVFHNPSDTAELLVAPASISGVSFAARSGGFLLVPGDFLALNGNVSVAWNAIANAVGTPLTIITSST